MTTVLTYGTFDLFHVGHVRLLKQLSEIGDKLIVGVSTDQFNREKGKRCLIPFDQRAEIVRSSNYVDLVIPEYSWKQKETDILKYNIDTFAMGSDWSGKFDSLKKHCKVVYFPRTEGVSTTEIKNLLITFDSHKIQQLKDALDILHEVARDLT